MGNSVLNGLFLDREGNKYWYKNGDLHREDGPAIEGADGTNSWYQNGKPHREDGPAIDRAEGSKYWYKNGKLHREDGPAFDRADGTKYWYWEGTFLGQGKQGFLGLWNFLTEDQKGNPNLLKWIPF